MSLATFGQVGSPALPELVDLTAARTGSWVVLERFGAVVCHGPGAGPCPAVLVPALLSKDTGPLRAAVTWARGKGPLRGAVDDVAVVAAELGGGATVWFVGGETTAVPELLGPLAQACQDGDPAVHDPVVDELLHPRGPARRGAAPTAQLLLLRSDLPATRLARLAVAVVAGLGARVHGVEDLVLVALPPAQDPAQVMARIPAQGLRAGTCRVDPDAADWVVAVRLATGSLRAAEALGWDLGDPQEPAVAAELLLQEAQSAAQDLVRMLPHAPLQRLMEHDTAKGSGELIASLTAWCGAGYDVPTAARALHVHVNTLRYRLKRAGEVSGLDLSRPRQLMALQLLLPSDRRARLGS